MTNSSNTLFGEISLSLVTVKSHQINTVIYIVGLDRMGWYGLDQSGSG
jgi:hypothetical protein